MKPTIESFDIYTGVLKSISDRSFEGDWIKLEDFKKAIKLQEEADKDRFDKIVDKIFKDYENPLLNDLEEESVSMLDWTIDKIKFELKKENRNHDTN